MFWNDKKIKQWAENGGVFPYDQKLVNSASIDLRLGEYYRKIIHRDNGFCWSDSILIPNEGLIIKTNELVLCHSLEKTIISENMIALLFLKSTIGRMGIEHLHAGFGDPGFKGQWTFELINHWASSIKIYKGQRICQLIFADCEIPEKSYGKDDKSHYQNQKGVTPCWTNDNKDMFYDTRT